MMRDAIVIATRNTGKAAELRPMLVPLGREILDLDAAGISYSADEETIETGDTFEENAIAKAQYFYALSGGRAVIADDSGLCVAALGGAPGVRSRRYSGTTGSEAQVSAANSQALLRALTASSDRSAEFVCALAYIDGRDPVVALGRTSGRILRAPVGAAGFGYDPLFWSDDLRTGFGEASERDKARVSHRARAASALIAALRAEPGVHPAGVDGAW